MLIRVEDEVTSLISPSKRLTDTKTLQVLSEFLSGTNNLSVDAKKDLFLANTKVAGLLSGGLVYALMAKKVAERYGNESGTGMNVIAAAVDADGKRAVFERGPDDPKVGRLIVVDDMIDKGGSILCAAHAAEDVFTGATINSGLYYSYAKGRIPPSQKKHLTHLEMEFQEFADLTESNQLEQAKTVLTAAYKYACENGVTLQRGWYIRAARYFEDSVALIGKEPKT
jgi:orotate phosphoribosyltransferase